MRNVTKLVCTVLALVIALSAASCSLTKQSSFKDDDIDVPVGVYIYYLYNAYQSAEQKAQQTDAYNSKTGKYNGKTSFLKVKITDDDGDEVVAEDWIKDTAAENFKNAVAIQYEFEKVGATLDEIKPKDPYYTLSYGNDGNLQYVDSGKTYAEVAADYEKYGISYDSWLMCERLSEMKQAAFNLEYAVDGPSAVTDDDLIKYYSDNYSTYSTISANLYTTDDSGVNTALSDDEIKMYESNFKAYAAELNKGASMSDVAAEYKAAYNIADDGTTTIPTENATKIAEDTTDDVEKAVLGLKEGKATYKIVGKDDTRMIWLIYKTPVKDKASEIVKDESTRAQYLREMKTDDFDDLLKDIIEDKDVKPSNACNGYTSKFIEKRK